MIKIQTQSIHTIASIPENRSSSRLLAVFIKWFPIFLHLHSESFKESIAQLGQTTFSLVQGWSYHLQYNMKQLNSNSKYNYII